MKTFLKVMLGLCLLLLIGGVVAFISIDGIAEAAVERGGTRALGVKTDVKSMDLHPFAGTCSLSGLDVANPDGFRSQSFLTLNSGNCALKLDSLLSDTVVIPSVELADIELALEQGVGKSNYSVILENLRRLESGEKPRETGEDAKKYLIKEVDIRNVRVKTLLALVPGQEKSFELVIPSIHLTDVGSGSGIPLSEVYAVVIRALLDAVAREGGGRLPPEVQSELNQGLDRLRELLEIGPGGLPRPADLPQIPEGIFGDRKSKGENQE
jgi:hypothetical protein